MEESSCPILSHVSLYMYIHLFKYKTIKLAIPKTFQNYGVGNGVYKGGA
jgi:hypothetical protein